MPGGGAIAEAKGAEDIYGKQQVSTFLHVSLDPKQFGGFGNVRPVVCASRGWLFNNLI